MHDIRIALVVCRSPAGRIRRNLDAMDHWIQLARKQDAALICFPELNITGYSNHTDMLRHAQPIPGPIAKNLVQQAASADMVILAGLAEKDLQGRIFASHLVIMPDGNTGVYRKLYIAPPERAIYTPGNQIPLFTAMGVKFGIQLCYDAHFPELATHMAAKGADLILMPHASPRGTALDKHTSWMRHLPARAFDNSVFVAACNQAGDNHKGLSFPGNAVIFDPSGNIIAQHLDGDEALLIADLKAERLNWVREHQMRYFAPNRRPELYSNSF